MAYFNQLKQYLRHFIESSLITAAVVPAADPAPITNCCHLLTVGGAAVFDVVE